MVPNVVQKNYLMAKIDLKDAYLTVPVAAEFRCLLAFPNKTAVSDTAIQTLHHSIHIFKDHQTSSPVFATDRCPHYNLSRRHVGGFISREVTHPGPVNSSVAFLHPRLHYKHREDYSSPN